MSTSEIVVLVLGFALGYWIISGAFDGKGKKPQAMAGDSPDAGAPPMAWHRVLGVAADADLEAAQAAYRTLIGQYHPDKVAGLGPDLQALAEQKSKVINAAYHDALRALGARQG